MAEKTSITIKIDGRSIETEPGKTIIQVADEHGIFIPRYCYHPGLSIAGNCRICMVKVEKIPKLLTACSTPVRDGMVIWTQATEVIEARRHVLEFLLLNHPVDCPVCDQAGECWLQDYYYLFGRYRKRYFEARVLKQKTKIIGPHVILDQERCILCSRCIRFCNEIARKPQLGFFERGSRTVLDVFPGEELDNPYSGCVVDVCPVGALLDRDFRFRARAWFLERTPSICPGCSTGCNIYIDANETKPYLDHGRRVFRLKPRYNPHVNAYWMCDEGRYNYRWLDDERVPEPLMQKDGRLQSVSWDEAFRMISEKLGSTTADRQAIVLSPQLTLEDLYAGYKFFVEKLGLKRVSWDMPSRSQTRDDFLIRPEKFPNAEGASLIFGHHRVQTRDIFEYCLEGKVDFLWIVGQNPERAYGPELWKNVTEHVSFVILQVTNEIPGMERADFILPACPYAEKDGTYINAQMRLQRIHRAVHPYKASLPDWKIFQECAKHLDREGFEWVSVQDVFEECATRFEPLNGIHWVDIGLQGISLKEREQKHEELRSIEAG